MNIFKEKTKGFTLIELLVVVAIIGLLASIIMASLNSARGKAKDAAIKQEVTELTKLMEMNYDDTGSYSNLQTCNWVTHSASSCNKPGVFSGTYTNQAVSICNNIVSNSPNPEFAFLACNNTGEGQNKRYSVISYLNNGKLFCVGSDGTSETVSDGSFLALGCSNNP